jgi:hypothetical protein
MLSHRRLVAIKTFPERTSNRFAVDVVRVVVFPRTRFIVGNLGKMTLLVVFEKVVIAPVVFEMSPSK